MKLVFFLLLFCFSTAKTQITPAFNFPKIVWQTFETQHFKIVFHQQEPNLAYEVAAIAEAVYDSVCLDLGTFPPRKTTIIVANNQSFSNGLANPVGHYIFLDTQNPARLTSGDKKWLEGLVTHEFTHIVTFHSQNIDPLNLWEYASLLTIPAWFTEGLAQFEGEKWDAHREMLLKNAYSENCLLNYKQLNGFSESGRINSRLLYEEGHSLVRFIAQKFGKKAFKKILQEHKKNPLNFSWTLKRAVGFWEDEIFNLWKKQIKTKLGEQQNFQNVSDFQNLKGFVLGVRQKDKNLACVKIENSAVWLSKLFLNEKEIDVDVEPYFDFDGENLVYSKTYFQKDGTYTNDLYLYEIKTQKKQQITFGKRATDPTFCKNKIVFTGVTENGSEIFELDLQTKNFTQLTFSDTLTVKFSPKTSPNGDFLLFSFVAKNGTRGIGILEFASQKTQVVTNQNQEARDGFWFNNSTIFFHSYETGIPNLKQKNLFTGTENFVTNDFYGVFNSSQANEDSLWVVSYSSPKTAKAFLIPIKKTQATNYKSFDPYEQKTAFETQKPKLQEFKAKPYNSFAEFRTRAVALTFQSSGNAQISALAFDPLIKNYIFGNIGFDGNFDVSYSSRHFEPTLTFTTFRTKNSVAFSDSSKKTIGTSYEKLGEFFVLSKIFTSQKNLRRSYLLWSGFEFSESKNNSEMLSVPEGKNKIFSFGTNFYNFSPTFYGSFRLVHSEPKLSNRLNFTEVNLRTLNYSRLGKSNFFLRLQNLANYRKGEQSFDDLLSDDFYYLAPLVGKKEQSLGKGNFSTTVDFSYSMSGIFDDFVNVEELQIFSPYFYFNRLNASCFYSFGKAFGDFDYKKKNEVKKIKNSPGYLVQTVGCGIGFTYWIFGKAPVSARFLYGKELSKGKGNELFV
ncbi:hypothetical protein IT568_13375, partial [bacterium]|nr:hypothetical protein [bacterium]